MTAKIIDGKALAEQITRETAKEIAGLGFQPGLGVILVGDDPASKLYVGLKEKACERVGIHFEKKLLPKRAAERTVLKTLAELNVREDIDAVLIQLPLPKHLGEDKIMRAIDPCKDVDGFHFDNIMALLMGAPRLQPGLLAGIMLLIKSTGMPLAGSRALIVANSHVFSEPLAKLLDAEGVAASFCQPGVRNLAAKVAEADTVIVAAGKPKLITGKMLRPGAIVIDVGTNRVGKKVVGDVDFTSASKVAGFITPVPGGVGPMTVAMLLRNTVLLAKKRRGRRDELNKRPAG